MRKEIGLKVRQARLRKGLSITDVAEAIGSESREVVYRVEGGQNYQIKTLEAICDVVGLRIKTLRKV